eukprot:CAMPEP_0184308206 /NCGR_PEP_ID=MMETSP1049-20130417/16725_1 /TAXON_ID=77928 /ORGANISM="Proteomonas sulcata, Strain CCMP704" /LENGTH=59 /DNA_ID=CAMNT_0026620845 /DNA_START=539 /DNA_END=718 /DNA_ORIENTATION=+
MGLREDDCSQVLGEARGDGGLDCCYPGNRGHNIRDVDETLPVLQEHQTGRTGGERFRGL